MTNLRVCALSWMMRYKKQKADAHGEIVQLTKTAQALRDELEKMRNAKDEEVQRVLAEGKQEAKTLIDTAQALRDELEK